MNPSPTTATFTFFADFRDDLLLITCVTNVTHATHVTQLTASTSFATISRAIRMSATRWLPASRSMTKSPDPDILAAAARLAGEDMCSIADLSSGEVRAILKLGHDVKRNPDRKSVV